MLVFSWLGSPRVDEDGKPVRLETRKVKALLAYLSLNPTGCSREKLAALFWPEFDQTHALANLRRALGSLNHTLPAGCFDVNRESVSWKGDTPFCMDVTEFRNGVREARTHSHSMEAPGFDYLEKLRQIEELYQGDFLEGLNLRDCPEFDDWQYFQREELQHDFTWLLNQLVHAYTDRGDLEKASATGRRWVSIDRLDGNAQQVLMEVYDRAGQRSLALRQYEDYARVLKTELGQEPADEIKIIYQRIMGKAEPATIPSTFSPDKDRSRSQTRKLPQVENSISLLKTKLYIPRLKANRITRQRLLARLDESSNYPLTLISAPAGFGKTTLLAEWALNTQNLLGWLSLDIDDNDPVRFLSYLITALDNVVEGVGSNASAILQTPQPVPAQSILTVLLNDLEQQNTPILLVLDDYQFISSHAVNEMLMFLLEHESRYLHLIIASRADPPLPLSRMRVLGKLLEIRTEALRFSLNETEEFFNRSMHVDLSPREITVLEDRTEGWIVGLQMAALSLHNRPDASGFINAFSGTNRYILDYLVEEALNRQPECIQEFLLKTSIFNQLSGSFCDKVLEDSVPFTDTFESSQAILEYLERANLFIISLDEERRWYRYHHLFSDMLQARFRLAFPNQAASLHIRASGWYEDGGLLSEAIQHAFLASDYERAAKLIEESSGKMIFEGNFITVINWLRAFPESFVRSRPWLCVWYAWALLASEVTNGVDSLLKDIEKALQDQRLNGAVEENIKDEELLNQLLSLQVTLASLECNHPLTIQLGLHAQQCLPLESISRLNVMYTLGNAYYITGKISEAEEAYQAVKTNAEKTGFLIRFILASYKLARIQQIKGHLNQAFNLYQDILGYAVDHGKEKYFGMGLIYSGISDIYYEWNRLKSARDMAVQSIRLDESSGAATLLANDHNILARILVAQHDLDAARLAFEKAERLIQSHTVLPEIKNMNEVSRIRLSLASSDLMHAAEWAKNLQSLGKLPSSFEREPEEIACARVFLAQRNDDQAVELLSQLSEAAEKTGRYSRLLEISVLLTRAFYNQNKTEKAFQCLDKSLQIGEPEGFLRVFVDEGESIEWMLKRGLEQGRWLGTRMLSYVNRILEAFQNEY
ncbi:MAG: BTAD domain-containing putative transcriptional regulator [Omnitrophica WOR_2 bacterium]